MLLPHYKSGIIYHDESLKNSKLEKQELNYPKNTWWDALDAASYVVSVLLGYGPYDSATPKSLQNTMDTGKAHPYENERDARARRMRSESNDNWYDGPVRMGGSRVYA